MAKTESAYDLTDAEKRDLIKLIEQGRPLPEKYRFLLFADKREVTPRFGSSRRKEAQTSPSAKTGKKDQSLLTSAATSGELTVAVELTDFSVYYS